MKSNLKVIRDNFNAMLDDYEKEGITVEDINKHTKNEQLAANVLADYFMNEVVKKRVPMFNEETKDLFTKATKDLVRAGISIGQYGFLSMLTENDFLEKSKESEKNLEELENGTK